MPTFILGDSFTANNEVTILISSISKRKTIDILKVTIVYFLLLFVIGVLLLPFFWMISTSFKPANEIFSPKPSLFPLIPTVSNYLTMWKNTLFPSYLKNTLIVSLFTVIITMVVALPAGYSISRFNYKGRLTFSTGLVAIQMFPPLILLIPMFIIMNKFGFLNKYPSLIIAYGTFALPFCTWMLKSYIDTVPRDLEDAAMIDGCSRWQAIIKILIPAIGPGLVTVAMFALVLAWQEYLFALTFMRTEEMRTVTVGVVLMQGHHGSINWGQIMACSVIACIPPLLCFLWMEKYIVQGFTLGAVKG